MVDHYDNDEDSDHDDDVFQKMYEEKMNHHLVLEILSCLCKRISEMSDAYLSDTSAHDAMLQAVKNGITEFMGSMRYENAELLLAMDESNRGIFAHAILNRQEEVFQLIHDIENKELFTSSQDTLGNNLLHIAAKLGPPRSLDRISNAALQMQTEV
ncbi:uncharacterized protein LOC114368556 [Glycine soja]|uniref:uncharacterized protein LOC114368556 n=1 Tax=Glycine soja TaxID=3848 RepID=UPI00103C9967|nr:uncharacterized protein LOC114368556 [Glycine soja]